MKALTARITSALHTMTLASHELFHVLLGILWFFLLKETIPAPGKHHVFLAVIGSLLPDVEHILYFYTHGKNDAYSLRVRLLVKNRKWKELFVFIKHNHKNLTSLRLHCFQWVIVLSILTIVSYVLDSFSLMALFGGMVIHYAFDIIDDIISLRKINPNWTKGIIARPGRSS